MGIFNETFGQAGTAQAFFGGEWWLVGMLLMLVFVLYFYGKGVNVEGLVLLIFCSILMVTIDNLFTIGQDIIMTIIVFILILASILLFKGIGTG